MKKKMFALLLGVVLIAALFAGCSSRGYDQSNTASGSTSSYYAETPASADNYYYESKSDGDYAYDEAESYTGESSNLASLTVDSALASNRKIILTANINMETRNFDASAASLREAVEALGGYISGADTSIYNSTYSLHRGYYTVRIPAENFSEFITRSESMGNVTSANVYQNDVTASYTDIETRLETLYAQKDRLLELMEQATEMYDIIELENALTDTIYQIESLTGQRSRYDDQIAYSTAYVNIEEVRDLTQSVTPPKTLGERISQEFSSSWENFGEGLEDFVVWLVGALPTILVLAVIAVIVIVIIRATKPRRERKKLERAEKQRLVAAQWQAAHAAPAPAQPQSAPAQAEKKE